MGQLAGVWREDDRAAERLRRQLRDERGAMPRVEVVARASVHLGRDVSERWLERLEIERVSFRPSELRALATIYRPQDPEPLFAAWSRALGWASGLGLGG